MSANLSSETGDTKGVLVVEDNLGLRTTMGRVLTQMGYETYLAASGEEAMAQYGESAHRIGLVLTDIKLPDQHGGELLRAIRKLAPECPAIIMTGNPSSAVDVAHDLKVPILQKPFMPDALIRVMNEALGITP